MEDEQHTTTGPSPIRKQRTPRAEGDDTTRVKLTAEARAALRELRTLIGFSGESEDQVLSGHVVAERDARVNKLKKGAVG